MVGDMPYKMKNVYILLLLLGVMISCSSENSATVHVLNDSGQLIEKLKIDMIGKSQSISNLKNGESITLTYHNLSDSHYTLNAELEDGSRIVGDFGYVTNGMNYEAYFKIHKGGEVEFTSSPK